MRQFTMAIPPRAGSLTSASLVVARARALPAVPSSDGRPAGPGFRLLGPLSLTDGDEVAVLPASKPATLLAALLLRPNVVVSTGRLTAAVWDEAVPAQGNAALHTCVRRLRRVLTTHGVARCVITAVSGGYQISADAETLDVIRFQELLAAAGRAHDLEAELRLLRAALAEWRGPLLANVTSSVLHRDEVPHLDEARLAAIERAVDVELQLGRCREVLAELWQVTRAHPERERFWEQLIEALYRTGRQAEALAEYRGVKGHLQEQLGIDPGPALQRLELAILRGDDVSRARTSIRAVSDPGPAVPAVHAVPAVPAVHAAPPMPLQTAKAAGTLVNRPSTLPVPAAVPSFTGREEVGARLLARLGRVRTEPSQGPITAVVSGPPGIGKTALALYVADLARQHFPGGCRAIRLTRPDGSPRPDSEARADLEAEPALGGAGVLLVLDDVVDEDQARSLMPSDASSATILTSRSSLSALVASSSHSIVVRPGVFTREESRDFLTTVLGVDRVDREHGALDRLAEVCGHFPLALRIAATRLITRPLLSVADYVSWLEEDPLARLSVGAGDRMSITHVFSTALDRLTLELVEAFVRIGAGALPDAPDGPDGPDGPDLLDDASPADAALLEQLAEAGFVEEPRAGRFEMHSLLRQFARTQLGPVSIPSGGPETAPGPAARRPHPAPQSAALEPQKGRP